MDPYPLIAFALRMPSRMASSLDAAQPGQASHMVVNFLSAEQASISVKFSRPDLYPEPFSSIPYSLSEEGLPIIDDALGAISCKVVSKAIPLHDLELLKGESSEKMKPLLEDCPSSKLFIAHVTRVESSPSDDEDRLPLLYHRRQYTSCRIPPCSPAMDP
jgi:flavin reductase (DIM6/NTAB) family NADH-FMN oxidoreductase RutF